MDSKLNANVLAEILDLLYLLLHILKNISPAKAGTYFEQDKIISFSLMGTGLFGSNNICKIMIVNNI